MTDLPEPAPDMTAAELALGLLDGEEQAAALRRVLADPDFAREVEDWRARLSGLFDDYPEVAAPQWVADRLASPDAAPPARPRAPRRWPMLAGLSAVAAAAALVFIARPAPGPRDAHAFMAASLMATDRSTAVSAIVDMTTGEMRVGRATPVPSGRSAQLWMIGDDGVPQPMGILAPAGPSRMVLPDETRDKLRAGITLAVSIEPNGGSPTGRPTGPVVASGKLLLT